MQEKIIVSLYEKLIQKHFNCLDIGAYHGEHAKIISQLASNGTVFAFEPHPSNFNTLNSNKPLNLVAINVAVSNVIGKIPLYDGKHGHSTEFNIRGKDLEENKTNQCSTCLVDTIDNYFKLNQNIDFIKLDVEGAEHLAIEGMENTLIKYKPIMIIEFHNDEGWQGSKILYNIGYKILNVYSSFSECGSSDIRECYHGVAMPKELNILL